MSNALSAKPKTSRAIATNAYLASTMTSAKLAFRNPNTRQQNNTKTKITNSYKSKMIPFGNESTISMQSRKPSILSTSLILMTKQ